MKRIVCCIVLTWAMPVAAGQVCLEKGTGKLIEYQSDGRPGTCTQNALQSGYTTNQVEERTMGKDEINVLLDAQFVKPAKEAQEAKRVVKQQAIQKIRQKLGLSVAEFEDLKEALQD